MVVFRSKTGIYLAVIQGYSLEDGCHWLSHIMLVFARYRQLVHLRYKLVLLRRTNKRAVFITSSPVTIRTS